MTTNRILAVVAAVLLVASVFAYRSGTARAERFESGQRFLPNLNPDDVAAIVLKKGAETVTLKRGEGRFTIVEAKGYPAKNEAVNRLLRDLVEATLDKEIGGGESLFKDLELEAEGANTVEVTLKDTSDKDMVRLVLGKQAEGGGGTFVRRADDADGTVYLTGKRLYVNAARADFLNKEIVDVKREDVTRVAGPDFELSGDGLKLAGLPAGREEDPAKVNQVKGALSYLRFDEVFVADDPAVRELAFEPKLQVDLKDGSGYRLALAERDGKSYMRISGYHTVDRVAVSPTESEAELKEKAEVLSRADEMAKFNAFHGSWAYQVNQATADKLKLTKSALTKTKA